MEKEKKEKNSIKEEAGEWVNSILIAFVAALILRVFIFAPTVVRGSSMDSTLHVFLLFASKFIISCFH